MNVLVTVQGKAIWLSDPEWEVLTNISRRKGARVASVLPSDSLVYERVLVDLVERGWVFLHDTETRPLAGPEIYLTKEGEAAVDTGRAWIKGIGTTSSRRMKR
jgi:hypothetical protein